MVMGVYLDKILEETRQRIDDSRQTVSVKDLTSEISGTPRDFLGAVSGEGIRLIAEFKRRSPSKGDIRPGADPSEIAGAYARAGASALSILTEPRFFSGSRDDLMAARESSGLPVLRKDFVIDPYQVVEARAMGADAVLLIVAALVDDALLSDLHEAITELAMTALVEVHDLFELERALSIGPNLLGVNQRDLSTFEVDTNLAQKLRPQVPAEVAVVAESGIATRDQVVALEEAGVSAILVGESLMRADDPEAAVRMLLGAE